MTEAQIFAMLDTAMVKLDAALRDGSIHALYRGEKVPREFWLQSGFSVKDFVVEDHDAITFTGEDILRVFPPHGDH